MVRKKARFKLFFSKKDGFEIFPVKKKLVNYDGMIIESAPLLWVDMFIYMIKARYGRLDGVRHFTYEVSIERMCWEWDRLAWAINRHINNGEVVSPCKPAPPENRSIWVRDFTVPVEYTPGKNNYLILRRKTGDSRTNHCPFCGYTHHHGSLDGGRTSCGYADKKDTVTAPDGTIVSSESMYHLVTDNT